MIMMDPKKKIQLKLNSLKITKKTFKFRINKIAMSKIHKMKKSHKRLILKQETQYRIN